ncbi:MAG: triose-phosphate isomerase [Candidatus Latescibacterota bacterium]
MARKLLIAANWKMYKTISEAAAFAKHLKSTRLPGGCDLLIFPPFLALHSLRKLLAETSVSVGAQDLFYEQEGAYTGEVSAKMIVDAGAGYVLIGHSERRHIIGENDAMVAKKLKAALSGGLKPVLCVGETIEQRETGAAESTIRGQLDAALSPLPQEQMSRIVIAYEPVWAIGTGRTATPDDAEQMHIFIRKWVESAFSHAVAGELIILYGGSVKPGNAENLLLKEHIDGALIGGASLEAESFLNIARAVEAK